ncbi:agamous-like MADS-box protein AGL61 [Bidens hawaiensis]|uniref:agamous-like MADS-box protein AGL61 n=1 Tax=Bidens hawaiensis TaxID=980011 RepID=UPI00404A45A6
MPRRSEGRRKIEIVKIMNESSSSVAFSKRRSGVFKKASELCTLCGVQLAVIVHSNNKKKVYSFGKPDVQELVNRVVNPILDPASSTTSQFVQHLRDANINELCTQLANVDIEVESMKKANEELRKMRKASQELHWWDRPVENIGYADLGQLRMAVSQLGEDAQKYIEKHMA